MPFPIIKISGVLNVSIDKLVGKEPVSNICDLAILRKDIFFDVVNYLLTTIQAKQKGQLKLEKFFNAVCEVYVFSLKKEAFDKEFADWFVNFQL